MDFLNCAEFEKKYMIQSIQRGKLLNLAILAVSFYSLYLDFSLYQNNRIDLIYRRNLMSIHIISMLLSVSFVLIYRLLEKSKKYKFSKITKVTILSNMFLTIATASLLSLNSQRYTGNIDAYIMLTLAAALAIPIYPKWVIGIYVINHIIFLIGLSYLCNDSSAIIKQFNSTTTVIVAMVLFLILYRYNVKNFLNEEFLKRDKLTFTKLLEITPFPLLISGFEDGKVNYANQKAMLFYDIKNEQLNTLNIKQLYINSSDLNIINQMLETNKCVNDFVSGHKTLSGQEKYAIVNYEMIDFFGERCILSGVTDITEIKRAKNEVTIHATTDELTGVLNRRVGMEILKKKLEKSICNNKEFNLCFLDIDNLKMVNDNFGHLEGDSLITDVCEVIKEETKANDIVFRYGGDEFMILFGNTSKEEMDKVCYRIWDRFEAMNRAKLKPYNINASIGIFSRKPEMNLSLDQIIEIVDRNMYNNKIYRKQSL
jgi:diguanylate cyclase (GGDEF)-like protein